MDFIHRKNAPQLSPLKINKNRYDSSPCLSLFSHLQKKQGLIDSMRKGTLFKLSGMTNKIEIKQDRDPYIEWLRQNSNSFNHQQNDQFNEMGQTYFYLNTFDLLKQKKLSKMLPEIQSAKKIISKGQLSSISIIKSRNLRNLSMQSFKGNEQFSANFKKHTNFINKKSESSVKLPVHRDQCYHSKLSKTQFFEEKSCVSPENLSSVKLNGPSKILSSLSHTNLKRFSFDSPKPFETTLTNLSDSMNKTCYVQVKDYFQQFRDQFKLLLQDFKANQIQNQKKLHSPKQKHPIPKKLSQANGSAEGFVPGFLMTTLYSPKKSVHTKQPKIL